jgi:Zn-dependent protease with chaperone function
VPIDAGIIAIFLLALTLAFLPALVDRWALRRGASPGTLVMLAIVTLLGVAAVPVSLALCTAGAEMSGFGRRGPDVTGLAGLLLVAIVAGRTLARVFAIRRRWRSLARAAGALRQAGDLGARSSLTPRVNVLPVPQLFAFTAGSEAFVSAGLLERLPEAQRRAVIEHEREHARAGHARLLGAARALAHGAFEVAPARRAAQALERELDALADLAAARRLGDPQPVREALMTVAVASGAGAPSSLQRRLSCHGRASVLTDGAVRALTLALAGLVLAAVCLSIHAGEAWVGMGACALLVASMLVFTRPLLLRSG